ncbi:LysR family transcriptional regulator [Pseudocitrobacter corydidari]|uniref:HTH-type transcriptional regulator YbdO n=1 Tax=Pseudocitrobacter corydidari TaxID=2891570 RepID=A0ABY3S7H8_9ENTR|nr:LysR family transcriptional regulator [Pseudocitrobacter corydidari]UGS42163.1 putative HTH-type transcriptional regulator YbdO [Pseudocitrobacter corydidari]
MINSRDRAFFDYNLIKVFDAVIKEGGVTPAAQTLGVTPASVSQSISKMQLLFDEALFTRTRKGLNPTMHGKELHRLYSQVIAAIEGSLKSSELIAEKDNDLVIMGGDLFENFYIPQIANADFYNRYKINHCNTDSLDQMMLIKHLVKGNVDILFTFLPVKCDGVECTVIDNYSEYVCIYGKESLLMEVKKLSLHTFYSSIHAMYYHGMLTTSLEESVELLSNSLGLMNARKAGYRSNSVVGLLNAVEQSAMIAVIPSKIAHYFVKKRRFDLYMIDPPVELKLKTINVYALYVTKSSKLESIKNFLTEMKVNFINV